MSRIASTFSALKQQGRKALIPFVTAGFPYADITPALMHGMVSAGADVIELGVPFSDPSADGPVIQRAGDKALAFGIGLVQILAMVRSFRQTNTSTPVVLMGYANPVERYDQKHAISGCVQCLRPGRLRSRCGRRADRRLPARGMRGLCRRSARPRHGPDLPAGSHQHASAHAAGGAVASGYVYYVSLKGVTGSGALDTDAVEAMLPRIRQHISVPVGVGFGIRDAATAKTIAKVADAVVIGSKIIQLLEEQPRDKVAEVAQEFLSEVRSAMDAG